jgi:hypothetical protein
VSTGTESTSGTSTSGTSTTTSSSTGSTGKLTVEFCGEEFIADPQTPLTIGRTGDIEIDDNPFLHRNFLQVVEDGGLWWLTNVGTTLTATVADKKGLLQAWLSPGARIPLALERFTVWFTAGPTTYDFDIIVDSPAFTSTGTEDIEEDASTGETTVGRVSFTPDQKLLMVALAEPLLRRSYAAPGQIPSSADAARRLGWKVTKFNRKLDNVCQKLADAGTRGLHGGPGKLASNRKARLVEHALSTRLVTELDLVLLDAIDHEGPGGQ